MTPEQQLLLYFQVLIISKCYSKLQMRKYGSALSIDQRKVRKNSSFYSEMEDSDSDVENVFGMEHLEKRCKVLSLTRVKTCISKLQAPITDPIEKMEQKVAQMEKSLKQKEKVFARKLNKLSRKLKEEDEIQDYLLAEIKLISLDLSSQKQTLKILCDQINDPEVQQQKKNLNNRRHTFQKIRSSKSRKKTFSKDTAFKKTYYKNYK